MRLRQSELRQASGAAKDSGGHIEDKGTSLIMTTSSLFTYGVPQRLFDAC